MYTGGSISIALLVLLQWILIIELSSLSSTAQYSQKHFYAFANSQETHSFPEDETSSQTDDHRRKVKDAHFVGGGILESLQNLVNIGLLSKENTDWVLDIGAFNGGFSIALDRMGMFPNAKFFLVEGNPKFAQVLDDLDYMHVIAIVGESDFEEVSFFTLDNPEMLNADDTGSSIYRENLEIYANHARETIRESFTIDTLLEMAGLGETAFDIIKLDIQGAELRALRGATKVLSRSRNAVVLMESSIIPYNEGADLPTSLSLQLAMEKLGFILFDVPDVNRFRSSNKISNLPVQSDLIFIRKESFNLRIAGYAMTWEGIPPPFPCHFELLKSPPEASEIIADKNEFFFKAEVNSMKVPVVPEL